MQLKGEAKNVIRLCYFSEKLLIRFDEIFWGDPSEKKNSYHYFKNRVECEILSGDFAPRKKFWVEKIDTIGKKHFNFIENVFKELKTTKNFGLVVNF